MAARVVIPEVSDWDIISSFLDDCCEGAVVIPPAVAITLREQGAELPEAGSLIEYDFGGEADVWLDVVTSPDHYAIRAVTADSE